MVQGLLNTLNTFVASINTKGKNAMNYMMTISLVTLAVSGLAIMSVWKS